MERKPVIIKTNSGSGASQGNGESFVDFFKDNRGVISFQDVFNTSLQDTKGVIFPQDIAKVMLIY